jgi:hypothetical protein
MKLFPLVLLLFSSVHCTSNTVFVCDNGNPQKYHHKKDCRGLANCTRQIISITLEEAMKSGRTLCGWEKPKANIHTTELKPTRP